MSKSPNIDQNDIDQRYIDICRVLGFVPRLWKPPCFESEDDSNDVPHPFRNLSIEDHWLLFEGGYLEQAVYDVNISDARYLEDMIIFTVDKYISSQRDVMTHLELIGENGNMIIRKPNFDIPLIRDCFAKETCSTIAIRNTDISGIGKPLRILAN